MACNLALSIQIVGVADETLLGLLTPELTLEVLKAVLTDLGLEAGYVSTLPTTRVETRGYPTYSVAVTNGVVRVSGGRDYGQIERISEAVGDGLRQLGAALLATKVQEALADLTGGTPEVSETTAEQDGQFFPVQVLTVSW